MTEKKWRNFKDIPLPKLLHIISLRGDEASVLDVARGMLKRKIYFKNGWPVNVVSNSMSDVLGRVMMEEGIISQKDYEKSLEIALKQKKRHGEVLISLGLISQKGLDDCLALQMRKKIWRVFNWHDGEYKYFLIKGGLPANLQLLPMNPASLIINGVLHGYYQFERAEADLKKFMDMPLVVSTDKPYKIEDLGLNTQQSRFVAGFDGTGKTKEIINNSDLLRREAELLTYGLIITNILSLKEKTVEIKAVPEDALRYEAHEEYVEKGAKEETYGTAQKMDAELIFQKGKNHFTEGNYEKAAAEFEEIVRLNPAEAEYKAYLGWTLFSKDPKNIKRAKSLLMESLSSNPDLDVAHMFLARLYIKEGLFKEAEGGLAAALGKNPFLPAAWKERAFIKIRACFDIRGKGYLDYFHLTKNPFDLLPDPDFFYQGDAHSEALHFLLNGIKSGKANVIILTGEKGSGKTSLCLKTMDAIANEKMVFVYIDSQPPLSPPLLKGGWVGLDILIAIKNELGIKTSGDFSENVISALHTHCSMCRGAKGRTVVILDNADKLNTNALRVVKTLLQIGIDNIIISGRPEVETMLNEPHLKEVKQAISGMHRLHPLGLEETKEYIFKRLASAGSDGKPEITPWAFKTIHNASLGNPEMINKICDLSLDLAMKMEMQGVDEQIVNSIEKNLGAELDERLPQVEPLIETFGGKPVEEKTDGLLEEKTRKIINEQIAAAVKEAVNKAMEDAGKTFEQKTQQIIEQRIGRPFEEKIRKIITEQTERTVEEAVKKEFEKRSAQPDPHASLTPDVKDFGAGINETIEKTESPPEEQTRGQAGQITSEQITDAAGYASQPESVFISFEADEKNRGRFAKSGLLIKILIFAIAVGAILAGIANYYDVLQKTDIFSTSSEIKPSQIKSVALPKIEPPPVKIAPPAAENPSALVVVQPAQEDKTPAEAQKTARESPEISKPVSKGISDTKIQGLPPHVSSGGQARLFTLTFELNGGRKETVFNGETFKVKRGDKIKIVSADVGDIPSKDITVNLLGFVSNKNDNTGEDRGYLIDTAKDMWKKHSTGGKGKEYPIVVKHKGEKIGNVVLKITD